MNNVQLKKICKVGGQSAILIGVSYMVITFLFLTVGEVPKNSMELLKYLNFNSAEWGWIIFFSVLTDLLLLPLLLALFHILKSLNKVAMIFVVILFVSFVVLDLTITWPNYASLIVLSKNYFHEKEELEQISLISSADYRISVVSSGFFMIYTISITSIAILLVSKIMLNGFFRKITAYCGILTGISGTTSAMSYIFFGSSAALSVLTSALTIIWLLLVGYELINCSNLNLENKLT